MADIIQLLPDSVANQIAAGEVIQRPGSVVKELMENAIDAEAKEIKVYIKEAGKTLIQVFDEGKGMSETDARLSIERHATSKIKKAEDLYKLRTMGFRGEALASIAAVAQVTLRTRLANQELGTSLYIENSEVKSQDQQACEKGTSISVKNLFFNIPARRNFLKSNSVEMKHIIEEFQRLALAYPETSFKLTHGDQVIHDLHPDKLGKRIVTLFGKSYQQQLAFCSEDMGSLKVMGYIGRPESAKKTRGGQYLYVNNRYIKNNYINHAVVGAFEGLLAPGSYPFYVLFIEVDPKHIDVNIHPTKTEIKFDDARMVYSLVRAAVKQVLGSQSLAPTIDFKADVNVMNKVSGEVRKTQNVYFDEHFGKVAKKGSTTTWKKLLEQDDVPVADKGQNTQRHVSLQSDINKDAYFAQADHRLVFQLHGTYIVRGVKSGIMIIDQQAAHERVLYENYISHLHGGVSGSQQSLFPQVIEFTPDDFALVLEIESEIISLGFRFEVFGKNTILVSGVPLGTLGTEKELFESLIEQFKTNQAELSLTLKENLAWSLAKKTAVKRGQILTEKEINTIIEGLFACRSPHFSSHGRTSFFILETSKIEDYFNP